MFAAVRTTRQCAQNTFKWTRAASSVPTPGGSTTSTPAPKAQSSTGIAKIGRRPPVARQNAKSMTPAVPSSSGAVPSLTTSQTSVGKDWKALGLKYDPATLPIKQTLDPNLASFTEEDYAMTLIHGRSAQKPFFHPRTHDIPVVNIHFRSHHVKLLALFTHFVTHAAYSLKIPCSQVAMLPTQRRLWTVLRSPFAHKKSQENFDRKVHKRAIKAWDADPEVVQRWIAYIREHAMPGIGMKVITWNRTALGVGSTLKEEVSVTSANQIRVLGEKIVAEETVAASGAGVATVE